MTAALAPLRRAFGLVNRRVAVPLLRVGGGPALATPVTGSILVLRTVGRRTGLIRDAPLGYALIGGRVVVMAGYGRGAHWFRNALADPRVEVMLPGALLAGHAEEITQPAERRAAFRTVIAAMGVVGRLTLGDVAGRTDAEVDVLAAAFPMLAITPTAVLPGPFDPGGVAARANAVIWSVLGVAGLLASWRRVAGRRRPGDR